MQKNVLKSKEVESLPKSTCFSGLKSNLSLLLYTESCMLVFLIDITHKVASIDVSLYSHRKVIQSH